MGGGPGPAVALPVSQGVVKHVMHLSAFVLLVCLSGRDNHTEVALVSALLCGAVFSPSRPSIPFSPLHDWSLCHYFLAAGGDPGNLVNPLTTNCLLLPCCLDKQPGERRGSRAPVTYKSHVGRGGSHCHYMDPCSPHNICWDF